MSHRWLLQPRLTHPQCRHTEQMITRDFLNPGTAAGSETSAGRAELPPERWPCHGTGERSSGPGLVPLLSSPNFIFLAVIYDTRRRALLELFLRKALGDCRQLRSEWKGRSKAVLWLQQMERHHTESMGMETSHPGAESCGWQRKCSSSPACLPASQHYSSEVSRQSQGCVSLVFKHMGRGSIT